MELSSVYHRPTDQFAYPYKKDTLHIRLKTKKDNIEKAELIYGDQYQWENSKWVNKVESLIKTGSDSFFDYWLIAVKPPFKRIRYGFILSKNNEDIIYTEKGFFSQPPEDPGCYFCFPYIHSNEVFRAPGWVKDTVWYQIFPERFANGNKHINPQGTKPWGSEDPSPNNFFGGDFTGILNHLDHLTDLGITGIYFTPIFKAKSNHKYDTIDYYEIDPQFGNKETFKELVNECHKRGIKIMLDAVFNHSGFQFSPFQDVLANGSQSQYADWFHVNEFPLKGGSRPNYDTFSFVESMPKLNTENSKVKEYLIDIGRYWVREFDIDGWRLDVANEIDHQFWREFRTALKQIKPDLYILGEVWHDAMPWLRGDQFDAVMNYPFLTNVLNCFAKGIISSKEFTEKMTSVIHLYPETINEALFNLIGSHDTPRVLTECDNNVDKAKLIFTFMLTFIGSPCIYYGDEVGLTGEMDPGCRKCMPWNENEQNLELVKYIKKLIHLRKNEPLLSNSGSLKFLEPNGPFVCFIKTNGMKTILLVFNSSADEAEYSIPFSLKGEKITDLLNNNEYAADANELFVTISPFQAAILSFSEEHSHSDT